MRTDDDSWIATSEATVVAEPVGSFDEALHVRVVSVGRDLQTNRVLEDKYGMPRLQWGEKLLPLLHSSEEERNVPHKQVYIFCEAVLTESDTDWQPHDLNQFILNEMLVPVLGSPPRDWQTIAQLLSTGGISASGAIAMGMGQKPSVSLVLFLGGMTVFVNVVVPVSRALGRGLEHRIDQLLDTPPREPSKDEASSSTSS